MSKPRASKEHKEYLAKHAVSMRNERADFSLGRGKYANRGEKKLAVMPKGGIQSGKDLNKHIGNQINKGIDKQRGKLEKGGHQAVDKVADWAKKKGGDKAIIDYGRRELKKGGSRLLREGAGAAKRWIHTEGRNAVNQGIHHIKEGAKNLGKRARGWFEDVGNKLKRRRT